MEARLLLSVTDDVLLRCLSDWRNYGCAWETAGWGTIHTQKSSAGKQQQLFVKLRLSVPLR